MAEHKELTARAREMQDLLDAQARSGQSLDAFAKRRRIPVGTLTWWRHRLRHLVPVGDDQTKTAGFVEVTPVARQAPLSTFEIAFGDGTVVRVPERFSGADLRRLLDVLGC